MNSRTLKALEGSIEKWRKIAYEDGEDRSTNNCPLCSIFSHKPKCGDCPVRLKTNIQACARTPYEKWALHHQEKKSHTTQPYKVECSTCKNIAKAELKFLRSLRPRKKRKP